MLRALIASLAVMCVTPPANADDTQLAQCARKALEKAPRKTVQRALIIDCGIDLHTWRSECAKRHDSLDPHHPVCQQELLALKQELEREVPWERQARVRQSPQSASIEAALKDLNAGRPLPGLPLLDRPVFVRADAIVCRSLGTLANPNAQLLLVAGACVLMPRDQRVRVVLPTSAREYIDGHSLAAVRIYWRSEQESVANTYDGWVRISELRN